MRLIIQKSTKRIEPYSTVSRIINNQCVIKTILT